MVIVKKKKISKEERTVPEPPNLAEPVHGETAGEEKHQVDEPQGVPVIDLSKSDDMDCYTGGWSQWREDMGEEWWDTWDWPPRGWRPSSHHTCYWDERSAYHQYRWKDWGDERTPMARKSEYLEFEDVHSSGPGTDESTTLDTHRSSTSDELQSYMASRRANTGDLQPHCMSERLDAAASPKNNTDAGSQAKPAVAETTQPSPSDKKDTEDSTRKAEEGETPVEQTHAPEEKQSDADTKKMEELKKRKVEAHNRYMRYYRNIRSPGLSFCIFMPLTCLPISFGCTQGKNTPKELRIMAKEATHSS